MKLIIGIVLCIFGAMNLAGNISMIHSYNRQNVSKADRMAFGRYTGSGTIVIGVGLLAASFLDSNMEEPVMITALAAGLVLIVYGQLRYNRKKS